LLVMVLLGPPWAAASGIWVGFAVGVLVAAAAAPFELAVELWRALAGCRHRTTPKQLVVMAALSEVSVRAVGRGTALALALIGTRWWVQADPWVSVVVVPALLVLLGGMAQERVGWWRTRRQGLTPVPPGPTLALLVALEQRMAPVRPVSWWVNGDAVARRATAASTWVWRGRQQVALDPAVVRGGPALLEAVAAHELAHELAHGDVGPRAWRASAAVGVRMVAVAGLGLLLGWALGEGPWRVGRVLLVGLGALTVAVPLSMVSATLARRRETLVDRLSVSAIRDPRASAGAARDLLVAAEVDLRPEGLRRWFAVHPPVVWRLALLAGGGSEGPGCVAIV